MPRSRRTGCVRRLAPGPVRAAPPNRQSPTYPCPLRGEEWRRHQAIIIIHSPTRIFERVMIASRNGAAVALSRTRWSSVRLRVLTAIVPSTTAGHRRARPNPRVAAGGGFEGGVNASIRAAPRLVIENTAPRVFILGETEPCAARLARSVISPSSFSRLLVAAFRTTGTTSPSSSVTATRNLVV